MKLRALSARQGAGFTLMEIMLVVMIIALLAGMLIMNSADFLGFGQAARVKGDISTLRTMLTMYRGSAGNYPGTSQGLKALVSRPEGEPRPVAWQHITDKVPSDPWGHEYVYVCPGQRNPNSYDLYSAGRDGQPGTDDDVWPD
jgi:general secretion pathway protein G